MRFDLVEIVSKGCKSEVHKCIDHGKDHDYSISTHEEDGTTTTDTGKRRVVAIKIINDKDKAFEEINKLLLVGHHNIISILDIVEDSDSVGIVMPFVNMDLRYFMGRVKYNTATMMQIKLQTMAAVHHIHVRGILHMDIKPENICIDFIASTKDSSNNIHCLLLDFGSSVVAEEMLQTLSRSDSPSSTIQSTKGYLSPELLAYGILSSACDIYSTGVVFSELAENRHPNCAESVRLSAFFCQLSLDMRHEDFKLRPSSKEVLLLLGGDEVCKPLLPISTKSTTPAWTSSIASVLISQCNRRRCSVTDTFIGDRLSTSLQKLVTLVRSSDVGHIRDAFWLLYETSVEEVDKKSIDCSLSVLSVLHYFDSRIYLANEHSFFYAKSLDILSHLPYFVLSDDMKLHLWKISSTSRSCERSVIRCLANCWGDVELSSWCIDDRTRWGVRQEEFRDFVGRFVDDWDVQCAKAAKMVLVSIN